MPIFSKPKSQKGNIGVLKTLIDETAEALKDTGRDLVRGVTMLPKEMLLGEAVSLTSEANDSSPKARISEKEGENTKINPAEMFRRSDEQKQEKVRQRLKMLLNQTYTKPSVASEYGQELVRERQQKQEPIYDRLWREKQEKEKREKETKAQQATGLPVISTIRKRGDWMHGLKRKKGGGTPQQLNRAEFKGGKGKS